VPGMKPSYTPIIYRGNREGGVDDDYRYVYTGQITEGVPKERYMRVEDLQDRLRDANRADLYRKDWEAMNEAQTDRFPVWNRYGDICSGVKFLREVYGIPPVFYLPLPKPEDDKIRDGYNIFCRTR
jgi:hypothetical protein